MGNTKTDIENNGSRGWFYEFCWLGIGFVLPCVSRTFYRVAMRRRVIFAVIFFFLLGVITATLTTFSIGKSLFLAINEIRAAYDSGDIPSIIIQDGIAYSDAQGPAYIIDQDQTIILIDTTGSYHQIDTSRYSQGFLLTRTQIHILNNNGSYRVLPLRELHDLIKANPIVLDSKTVPTLWLKFSLILTVFVWIILLFWNNLIWFMFITFLALIIWGIVSLIKSGTNFGPIFVAGLYTFVPTLYLSYLLRLTGIRFFGLQTLLFLFLWIGVLFLTLNFREERPLRMWSSILGAPLLILIVITTLFNWKGSVVYLWSTAFLTLLCFFGIEIISRYQLSRTSPNSETL